MITPLKPFAGISDEAGSQLEQQLHAQAELGWALMELRNVNGQHICDLSQEEWKQVYGQIQQAGQQIIGFCGRVGDGRHRIDTPFEQDVKELRAAIPRMQACGARLFRCMSFPNSKAAPWETPDWRKEVIRRLRELAEIAADGGVILAHENCSGYGAVSPQHCMELVNEVDHPSFGLILDTGNPGHHPDGLDAWQWYEVMREAIVHLHVKDYRQKPGEAGEMCFPGEGVSGLDRIFLDLAEREYSGFLSIEPHLHQPFPPGSAEAESRKYELYLEHGRKTEALWTRAASMPSRN